jgi:hypothetical protein
LISVVGEQRCRWLQGIAEANSDDDDDDNGTQNKCGMAVAKQRAIDSS